MDDWYPFGGGIVLNDTRKGKGKERRYKVCLGFVTLLLSPQTYMMSLLEPLYTLVGGFEEHQDDPQLLHYKRSLALSWTCKLGYKDCVDNSVSLYQAWMASAGNT